MKDVDEEAFSTGYMWNDELAHQLINLQPPNHCKVLTDTDQKLM
jgi:hypothetical protein